MSQEVSSNPRTRAAQGAPPPIKPWSAESAADNLMDELFGDIDRILEGGNKLPTEPVKPEYVSLQPIVIPQITIPSTVVSPQEPTQEPITEPTPIAEQQVQPLQTSIVHNPSPPPGKRSGWSFEKFLVAAGLASVIATILLLLASQKKLTWPWTPNSAPSSSEKKSQLSVPDAEFVNYMRRSLDVLDSKSKAKQKTTASVNGTTNQLTASAAAPSIRPPASNPPQTNVLERVYIPVYPPQGSSAPSVIPQALRPPIPALPQTFRAPSPAQLQTFRAPSPAQLQPIKPQAPALPQAAKPSTPAQPQPIKPQAPALPQKVAAAPLPSATIETAQSPQSSAPAVQHTLMGVMELGDRSAALFEVNGVTQRFNVGEAIGSSGWTLVSVTNSEAVVRRNGEVRSIYPGQKF